MKKVKFNLLIFIVPLIFFLLIACGPKHRIVYEKPTPPPEKKELLKEEKPVEVGSSLAF
jgi:hypothetical protein